jgi:hypothetical protein
VQLCDNSSTSWSSCAVTGTVQLCCRQAGASELYVSRALLLVPEAERCNLASVRGNSVLASHVKHRPSVYLCICSRWTQACYAACTWYLSVSFSGTSASARAYTTFLTFLPCAPRCTCTRRPATSSPSSSSPSPAPWCHPRSSASWAVSHLTRYVGGDWGIARVWGWMM